MSKDRLRPSVDPRRGWGWVFGGGFVVAVVAFPAVGAALGGAVWWLVARVAGLVWGLPYVPWIAAVLVAVAAAVVGYRTWKGWGW